MDKTTNKTIHLNAILLLACICSRILTSIYYIEDIDSLRFALSLEEYNLSKLQPHFPGYPVFCFIAKIIFYFTGNKGLTFSIIGGASTFIIIYFILKINRTNIDSYQGFFSTSIIFFNPLFWIMSNRYMPDLMGIAISIAAIYFLIFNKNDQKNIMIGYFLIGLLAGVRLSYLPLLLLPFIYFFIVYKNRTFIFSSFLFGFLVWFIPFAVFAGPGTIFEYGIKQYSGHFYDYGGTIFTENDLLSRLKYLLQTIWADGFGGYLPERSMLTLFLSVFLLVHFGSSFTSIIENLKFDKKFKILIYCTAIYTVWIFFFQNIIYKSRHIMPIISTLLILLTTKHSNIFMTNYFVKKIANGAFILLFTAITFKLAVQHKNPNAISQLKDFIINENPEKVISIPLINYYLKAHGVKSDFTNLDNQNVDYQLNIDSLKLNNALLIGNFKGIFESEYKVSPMKIFYHNPYVNRMWSEIRTFQLNK